MDLALWAFGVEWDKTPYCKYVSEITGSVTSAILFQQVLFNFHRAGERVFYKFQAPCDHPLYSIEDSWLEELGFGLGELRGALSKIATKAKTHEDIKILLRNSEITCAVVYYQDLNNVTWYYINKKVCLNILASAKAAYQKRQERIRNARDERVISRNAKFAPPITESAIEDSINTTTQVFEIKEKPLKPKKPKEESVVKQKKLFREGFTMPENYVLMETASSDLVEQGFEQDDVDYEFSRFKQYYTQGKGKLRKHYNWEISFCEWMNRNYRNGYLKRYGKVYRVDANEERVSEYRRQANTDLFADVTD